MWHGARRNSISFPPVPEDWKYFTKYVYDYKHAVFIISHGKTHNFRWILIQVLRKATKVLRITLLYEHFLHCIEAPTQEFWDHRCQIDNATFQIMRVIKRGETATLFSYNEITAQMIWTFYYNKLWFSYINVNTFKKNELQITSVCNNR